MRDTDDFALGIDALVRALETDFDLTAVHPALGQITTLPGPLGSAPDAAIALGNDEILVRGANRLPDLLRWDGQSLGQLRARWRKGKLVVERIAPPRNGQSDANPAATTPPYAAALAANAGEPFTLVAASRDGAKLFVMVRLAQGGPDGPRRAVIALRRQGDEYAELWRRTIDGIVVFRASPDGAVLAARIIPESREPAPTSSQPPAFGASLVVSDGASGAERRRKVLETPSSGVPIPPTLIAVSPSGDDVIYQDREGVINAWRYVSNIERDIPLTNGGAVSASAFNPNGRLLAIATGPAADAGTAERRGDAGIAILAWPSGDLRLGWPLGAAVTRLAFSRSGLNLAAGGREETVRIWDVTNALDGTANGQEYEVARVGSTRPVNFFAFSTDDTRIITLDSRHFVSHVWQDGDLLREACARVTRNLDVNEWKNYVPNVEYHKTCAALPP